MAKVIFVCGFIGSGKTTYSKRLVDELGAYRFSIDEWILPLFGENLPRDQLDRYSASLTKLFRKSALELLKLNVNVIFDFGFWQKKNRDDMQAWAIQHSLDYQLVYLSTSFEKCCDRALKRNSESDADNYFFTKQMLLDLWQRFEPPSSEEQMIVVDASSG